MRKRKIIKRIEIIAEEIREEIYRMQDKGQYRNIGKEGCLKRLNNLLSDINKRRTK